MNVLHCSRVVQAQHVWAVHVLGRGLRVRSVTFSRREIPAKCFFRPNIISCEKVCCSVMFSHTWKHYLDLITPANPKYDSDPWFCQDCVTVWRCVWLVWCDPQPCAVTCMHTLWQAIQKGKFIWFRKWCVQIMQKKLWGVKTVSLFGTPPDWDHMQTLFVSKSYWTHSKPTPQPEMDLFGSNRIEKHWYISNKYTFIWINHKAVKWKKN